tara:strand:+ start:535 stop:1104 length:570 start_codon:yes stop_codon:yes gene_type:complete
MVIEKINEFISIAIENSNIERNDFSDLNKKKIAIILRNTSTIIYLNILDDTIILSENIELEPDLTLEGSPIAFLNYFSNIGGDHSISISGEASLAESFSNIAKKINIDWEQILSEYTNDDIAFYSSRFFSLFKNKAKEIEGSFLRNMKEYIRDETDIIPSKDSINNYIKEVDNLSNKLDVLDIKLKKVK